MLKHTKQLTSETRSAAHRALGTLLNSGAKTATAYVSEKLVVRIARRTFRNKHRGAEPIALVVTIGRPNHAARTFIKTAKRAGEPFPIRKAQLTFARAK